MRIRFWQSGWLPFHLARGLAWRSDQEQTLKKVPHIQEFSSDLARQRADFKRCSQLSVWAFIYSFERSFCPFSPPPSSHFFGMLKPDAHLFTQIKEVGTHITNNMFISVTTKDLKCLSRKLSMCLDPFPNINQYWLDLLFPKLAFYTWNQCRWRGNIPCKQFCWLSKRTFSTSQSA